MTTEARLAANIENAKRSTGPRTAAGKAISSKNAVRHGLTGRTLIVRDDERAEFDTFQKDLESEVQPRGALQTEVYGQLLLAAWNLRRLSRIEAELIDESIEDPLLSDNCDAKLRNLDRYRARNEKSFHAAMTKLAQFQEETIFRQIRIPPESRDLPKTISLARARHVIAVDQKHFGAMPHIPGKMPNEANPPAVSPGRSASPGR